MKRKQVNASSKVAKQAKVTKKAKVVEECVEEQKVPVEKIVEKKSKKVAKAKIVVEEPEQDEYVSEQEMEDYEDEDDENSSDAEDEIEEELNENESEDESEKVASEKEASEKETKSSKVKSGPIPPTTPPTQVIQIGGLPLKVKQKDIIEAFNKYGEIEKVHVINTMFGKAAKIAFKSEEAALAALKDHQKVKVKDNFVSIAMRKDNTFNPSLYRDRSVYVKNFKPTTTEEQLRKHFKSCGEIEHVKLINKFSATFCYITFTDASSIAAALKLHNSILNEANIKVNVDVVVREANVYDDSRTIILRNKQNLENICVKKIEGIFAKCGEINFIDVVCKKNVLAFVTFTTEDGAKKGLKMNGKTVEGLELETEKYSSLKKWTTVHILNLPKDCTEEELSNLFSKAGEIAKIMIKPNYAIIRFSDSDGYCKSFLLNESFLRGEIIFVEPHSARKNKIIRHKQLQRRGPAVRHERNSSAYKAKKHQKKFFG